MSELSLKEAGIAAQDMINEIGADKAPVNGASMPADGERPEPQEPQAATPPQPKPLGQPQQQEEPQAAPAPAEPQEPAEPVGTVGPAPLPPELMGHSHEYRQQLQLLQSDWQQVQHISDPQQRAAAEQQLVGRRAQLQQYGAILGQAVQEHQQGSTQQSMAKTAKSLLKMVPEWSDTAVLRSEGAAIESWMTKRGYPPGTLKTINDPRALRDLRTLWLKERPSRGRKPGKSKPRTQQNQQTQTKPKSQSGQVAAVNKLLRSL